MFTKYELVGFNEQGKENFPDIADSVFLFVANIPNNESYCIVKGFRGKYTLGNEFVELSSDLRKLTTEEIENWFSE